MKTIYDIKRFVSRKFYTFKRFQFGEFGSGSCIYKPLMLSGKKHFFIGKNVNFREGARIEAIDEWCGTKYNPKLKIGDNVTFEQFANIAFAGNLDIGDNCTFSLRTMITTIDHKYNEVGISVLKQGIETNDVRIGKNCFIGIDVKIFPGTTIGDGVIVGANSIVLNDLPPYTVCVGVPATPIKRYDFEERVWKKI